MSLLVLVSRLFHEAFNFLIVYNTDYVIFVTFVCAFNCSVIGKGGGQTHKTCRLLPPYLFLTKVLPLNFILDPLLHKIQCDDLEFDLDFLSFKRGSVSCFLQQKKAIEF